MVHRFTTTQTRTAPATCFFARSKGLEPSYAPVNGAVLPLNYNQETHSNAATLLCANGHKCFNRLQTIFAFANPFRTRNENRTHISSFEDWSTNRCAILAFLCGSNRTRTDTSISAPGILSPMRTTNFATEPKFESPTGFEPVSPM